LSPKRFLREGGEGSDVGKGKVIGIGEAKADGWGIENRVQNKNSG